MVQQVSVSNEVVRSFLRRSLTGAASLALVVGMAMPASAQMVLDIAPQVGYALPTGAMKDVVSGGPSVGLDVSYKLNPRLALQLGSRISVFQGIRLQRGFDAPNIWATALTAGVEATILPKTGPFSLLVDAGGGRALYRSNSFLEQTTFPTARNFRPNAWVVRGGGEVGFGVTPATSLFIHVGAYYSPSIDETHMSTLQKIDPDHVSAWDSALTIPITIGVRSRRL